MKARLSTKLTKSEIIKHNNSAWQTNLFAQLVLGWRSFDELIKRKLEFKDSFQNIFIMK